MKSTLNGNKITKGCFLFILIGIIVSFGFVIPEIKDDKQGLNKEVKSAVCKVIPIPYDLALRNPLMGFTTRRIYDHPWATTAHTYIKWSDIENQESDGIDKIKHFCDSIWLGIEQKNIKVIPRVYMDWNGKFWPADMQKDDYTSEQFQKRVLRLIERLGECWDNDPRVAFVEMGIFGACGEHCKPNPTQEMRILVGDAFVKAFKNKQVSVRHIWRGFENYDFGIYWDSWAHFEQMYPHGNQIKLMNDKGYYLKNYVGGEVAYGWGDADIQPGPSPTATVAEEKHRNFMINTIKWLHCSQLRWIDNYDQKNVEAAKGAEEIQKAFGYRFVLDEVRFSLSDLLNIEFDVTNTGSAPFYYNWPVEVALLDPETKLPVWKSTFDTDIRNWKPGEGWTDPDWKATSSWAEKLADSTWNSTGVCKWAKPPVKNSVKGSFKVNIPKGKKYIISLAILDPAGNLPSVKFATVNYLNGGRFPIGMVDFGKKQCNPLPAGFKFDDPGLDNSLHYVSTGN